MATTLYSKFHLNDDQIESLMDLGMVTKINWYVQNMTTNQFVNYGQVLGTGERVKGNQPLNLTFPDGYFMPGTEVKAAVGKWDVLDVNGRHCQQTAFFYIDQDGTAIPCKYKELPSQNNGVIPQMPADFEIPAPSNTTQATLTAKADCACAYRKLSDYVGCELHDFEPHSDLDSCSDMDPLDSENPDLVCMYCKHHRDLFIKG